MIARLLGKQAIWSFIGYAFTFLVGFPLQLYVARTVGAAGLGSFNLIEASVGITATLLSCGLASSILKFLPQWLEHRKHDTIRRVVREDLQRLAVLGSTVILAAGLMHGVLPAVWTQDLPRAVLMLAAGLVPLSLLLYYLQQVLRAFLAAREVVFGTSILQLSVKAALLVVLLQWGMGVPGLVVAAVLSCGAALAYSGLAVRRHLAVAAPMDPHSAIELEPERRAFARNQYKSALLGLFSAHTDRYLLGYFVSVSAVGIFGTTRMLAALPGVFLQLLVAGAAPLFSRFHATGEFDKACNVYHLANDWCVRLSFPFFAFIMILGGKLLAYFGEEFAAQGTLALQVLVFSALLNTLTGPLGMFMTMWGGERLLLRLGIVTEVVMVTGYVCLIPAYGMAGAAATHLATMLVSVVGGYVLARRHAGITWFDSRYLRWFLPMACFIAGCLWFRMHGVESATAFEVIGIFVALSVLFHLLFLVQGLHEDDKLLLQALRERLRGWS